MTEIRALIGLVISIVISLFTPIGDVMIAMLVPFTRSGNRVTIKGFEG